MSSCGGVAALTRAVAAGPATTDEVVSGGVIDVSSGVAATCGGAVTADNEFSWRDRDAVLMKTVAACAAATEETTSRCVDVVSTAVAAACRGAVVAADKPIINGSVN